LTWPVYSKGALAGAGTSLLLVLWIGTGAQVYKPSHSRLPVNRDGCLRRENMTDIVLTVFSNVTTARNIATAINNRNEDILWVYRISYMWYIPIAIVSTLIVGVIVSVITGGNKEDVDSRLLSPLLLKLRGWWRKRNHRTFATVPKQDTMNEFSRMDVNEEDDINLKLLIKPSC